MADINNLRSNKRRKQPAENSNEPPQNKDAALCDRKKNCWTAVENFVCNFRGDDRIRTKKEKRKWDPRTELVEEANEWLNDPLFMLEKFRNSIEPSMMEHPRLKKAFQEVELVLKQSKNPVPAQNPNQNNTDETTMLEKGLQLTKEDLKSIKEELMQKNAIGDLKEQSVKDAKTFMAVSQMLSKVAEKYCCIMVPYIMNSPESVQQNSVQREDGQLTFNFPPTPDSIQMNQSGKVDDIHNSEMLGQEELRLELDLTLVFVEMRPEKLILKTQRGQKMPPSSSLAIVAGEPSHRHLQVATQSPPLPVAWPEWMDTGTPDTSLLNDVPLPVPGSSDGIGNESNMNLSSDEKFVSSKIQIYKVKKDNVGELDSIFQLYPDIDKEFKLKHPYFQSVFMNKIAESCKSIESIYQPKDIRAMYVTLDDMELTGLEITWLREKLTNAHQMLRNFVQEHLNELDKIYEARS